MEYHRVNTARTSLTVKCWTRVTGWKVPISPILLFCHFVAFVALMVSSRSWTIAIFFELSWRQTSPQFHSGWYLLTVSSVTCTADNPEVKEIVILSNSRNLHERRINTTYNRDFHVWLSCGSWHDRQVVLCKYCSIIALICVTPVWCVPCFPRYTHCAIWMQNNSEMYFLHGTALFIPFALLLLQVRSMRNQGQGQRQSHLTSVTGFTFITIGCDHARSGSFIVKNHDNCAAAQKVCHRYGIMWLLFAPTVSNLLQSSW